jgi:hypothetical protein
VFAAVRRQTTAVIYWVIRTGSDITAVFYWPKISYFLSLVKREGDLRTKVRKSEERFNISRFKAGIKSLSAKAALPPIKLVSEGCNRGTLGGTPFTKGRKRQRGKL